MTNKIHTIIEESGSHTWEGVFYFHPNDGIYLDHFPGYPVVPGSLIVHAFLRAATEAGISEKCITLENFRFREFLTPGCYPFRMECRENRLNCRIYRGDKILVTGVIIKESSLKQ
jgi:3-hydroxyacyl-[acyl-carrier-protein] dehydratase